MVEDTETQKKYRKAFKETFVKWLLERNPNNDTLTELAEKTADNIVNVLGAMARLGNERLFEMLKSGGDFEKWGKELGIEWMV